MTALQTNLQPTYPPEAAPPSFAGPVWTALIAFVTLGFAPAFFWAAKWARFVRDDRRFWLDVIAAVRPAATTHADASVLDDLARRISRPRVEPAFCQVASILIAVATFVPLLDYPYVRTWELFFSGHRFAAGATLESARLVWEWSLFAVFVVQWYAVRSYTLNVSELVNWTNRRAKKFGGPKAKNEATRAGLFPWWVIVAVAFCCGHAWWGIPMAMTGALARRYSGRSSTNLRAAVSLQLDTKQAFPAVVGPGVRYCGGPGCGRRLPDSARFCPRCGAPGPSAATGQT